MIQRRKLLGFRDSRTSGQKIPKGKPGTRPQPSGRARDAGKGK